MLRAKRMEIWWRQGSWKPLRRYALLAFLGFQQKEIYLIGLLGAERLKSWSALLCRRRRCRLLKRLYEKSKKWTKSLMERLVSCGRSQSETQVCGWRVMAMKY